MLRCVASVWQAVRNVTKDQFWNLDSQNKDPHDIEIKLTEMRKIRVTTLDLSYRAPGIESILHRWPYGMQVGLSSYLFRGFLETSQFQTLFWEVLCASLFLSAPGLSLSLSTSLSLSMAMLSFSLPVLGKYSGW